jgi:hypothetical protein
MPAAPPDVRPARIGQPRWSTPLFGLGREAGSDGIGDAGCPLPDLGPVPKVPLGDTQGRHDRPFREAELLADQLAGEHPMLAGAGGGEEVGHVDGVFLGLGGVADRAAGEEPHRPAGKGVGVTLDQLSDRLQPVPGVHRAAHHDRVVAVDPLDLLGREHRGRQPGLA